MLYVKSKVTLMNDLKGPNQKKKNVLCTLIYDAPYENACLV